MEVALSINITPLRGGKRGLEKSRLENKKLDLCCRELLQTRTPNEMNFKAAPIKSPITIADLDKIDIRVGTIVAVEDVTGSDKLGRLKDESSNEN